MLLKTRGKFFERAREPKMCMKTKEIRVYTCNPQKKLDLGMILGVYDARECA